MKKTLGRSTVMLAGALAILAGLRILHSQQSQRFPQFENDSVRVWRTVVLPNVPLTMHRHDHPRIIIALTGGTMKFVDQGGSSVQQVWETGKAYWLPSMPPNTMHADVNAGDKPIEVMVIEMKKEQ